MTAAVDRLLASSEPAIRRLARSDLLTSGSAVRALRSRIPVVAIGPQTAAEARRLGFDVVAAAEVQTVDGLVEALASLT